MDPVVRRGVGAIERAGAGRGVIEVTERDESVASEDHETKDEVPGEERNLDPAEVVRQCQRRPHHGVKIIERGVVLTVGRNVRGEEDERMVARVAMPGSDFEATTMVHRTVSLSGPADLETRTELETSLIRFKHDVF